MNKKIVATLIILIMIFMLLPVVKATDKETVLKDMLEKGEVTITSDDKNGNQSQTIGLSASKSQVPTLASTLSTIVSLIPLLMNNLMSAVALNNDTVISNNGREVTIFTIENLLTNKYPLFDINLFEDVESGPNSNISNKIKKNAAIWYISIRNIAIAGSMIVLVYVGIRMAIATTAEEKAKYKQMLTSWVIGVALLFVIHYIVLIMIKVSNLIIEFISSAIESDTETIGMELQVLTDVFRLINKSGEWNKLYYAALYCVMTYYELKFFIMYLFRVFKIFILMVLSPLICMTYSIDAVGDGKAQGFNNWFKTIMMEIFMQPIHLIIYVVFIYSAGEIAKVAPLVAICLIIALDNAEKIIRSALKIKEGKGLKDINILGKGKK